MNLTMEKNIVGSFVFPGSNARADDRAPFRHRVAEPNWGLVPCEDSRIGR